MVGISLLLFLQYVFPVCPGHGFARWIEILRLLKHQCLPERGIVVLQYCSITVI